MLTVHAARNSSHVSQYMHLPNLPVAIARIAYIFDVVLRLPELFAPSSHLKERHSSPYQLEDARGGAECNANKSVPRCCLSDSNLKTSACS